MKKLVTLMLVLSMVVSMAACGNTKNDLTVNETKDQIMDEEMSETEHSASSDVDMENSIPITMDNWETYFDLKLVEDPFINESGKVESWDFLYVVFLKPEYVEQYNFGNVDFELSYDLVSYECTYDEQKVTLGKQIETTQEGLTATFGLEDFRDNLDINNSSVFFNTVAGVVYGGSAMEQEGGNVIAGVPENGKILHAEGSLVMK